MKLSKATWSLALAASLAAGVLVAPAAEAGPWHHWGVGVYVGPPYWGPWWGGPYYGWGYPGPYYYPPAVVGVPTEPPTYVYKGEDGEPTQSGPAAGQGYYWYHCESPDGYYPYIKECPGGWKRVTPTPPTK